MSDTKILERLKKLKAQLAEYSYQYYVNNESSVDDSVYDGLMNELKDIESKHPELVTPDSPTQRVGGQPIATFKNVTHMQRMLSLNDVFSDEEVHAWIKRINKLDSRVETADFWVDVKMDGLACAIYYKDGELQTAVTRGDGTVGEDVTHNVRTISSVPLKLRGKSLSSGRVGVRGEIIMQRDELERINKQREKQSLPVYANPRNLAAGTIRQLDPKLTAQRKLFFRAFDIFSEEHEFTINQEVYATLTAVGFKVNVQAKSYSKIDQVIDFAHKWEKERTKLPFDTDGLVIKLNDRSLYTSLGVVGKNPRGAVAYKYPAEQTTTKVKDIFISIGRTGAATPVAVLEPVRIAGSTVQMATLHNQGEIARKDIRVGDTVVLQKAGDIIPEVVEPIVKLRSGSEKPFVMPSHCPDCNTLLVKLKADEAVWRCPNLLCPARSQKSIEHFASKGALDIEGLGEKNVMALLAASLIADQADIYSLTKDQVEGLDRFADVSASKLVAAIAEKKTPPLSRFLFALGIRHVGVQTAIDLSNRFRSMESLAAASVDELSSVDGVGEVVAEAVAAWFADAGNQKLLEKFTKAGVEPQKVAKVGGPLQGKAFVVTGTLTTMSRDQAAERIRTLGGTFQSSIGKDTDYLVVGQNVGASKLAKASKLGTQQISETDLQKLLKTAG